MSSQLMYGRKFNTFLVLFIGVILGTVYIQTLLPGIGNSGDTAKFAFAGYVLGTAHGSGYPTYMVLNHFFTSLIPIGSLAYRANLLSAVFSIIALIFIFRILLVLKVNSAISFLTCLVFGFTNKLWSQSIVAEVYTLHILFISLVIYFFLRWSKEAKEKDLLLGCCFYAFSFGNSPMMITLFPSIVYLIYATNKNVFVKPGVLIKILIFIAIGALQYSYSLWRYHDPQTKYLEIATPDLKSLWLVMTGAQFKSFLFSIPLHYLLRDRIPEVTNLFLMQFLYCTPLAILGAKALDKRLNIFFITFFVLNFLFSIEMDVLDWSMYLLANYFIIAIYLGLAFDWLYRKLPASKPWRYSAIGLFLLFPVLLAFVNYSHVDQHKNTLIAKTAVKYLGMVGSNALIISPGYDASEYLWYYLIGEGLQEPTQIYVGHDCSAEQIRAYIQENTPIYLPIQRIHTPRGLQVYCLGPRYLADLQSLGLKIEQLRMGLFKISK